MRKVLLIEPHSSGHHPRYLCWIAKGLVEKGVVVEIGTLESSLSHPLLKELQRDYSNQIKIFTIPDANAGLAKKFSGIFGLVWREFSYYRLLKRFYRMALKDGMPDAIMIPFLEYCSYAIALRGSPFAQTPWSGIVMLQSFHHRRMGIVSPDSILLRIKERLFIRLLKNATLKTLFTIDHSLKLFIDDCYRELAERLRYLPDPAVELIPFEKQQAKEELELPADSKVILVYGALTFRKGIDYLIMAACESNFPNNVCILLAGKQSAEVKEYIKNSPDARKFAMTGRLYQVNGFIDDEKESVVFSAADIIWLGYKHHYTMSSVMVQAGKIGCPVISVDVGLLRWYTENFGLGIAVRMDDPKEVAAAVERLLQGSDFMERCTISGKAFFSKHTVGEFINLVSKELAA